MKIKPVALFAFRVQLLKNVKHIILCTTEAITSGTVNLPHLVWYINFTQICLLILRYKNHDQGRRQWMRTEEKGTMCRAHHTRENSSVLQLHFLGYPSGVHDSFVGTVQPTCPVAAETPTG